MAEVLQWGRGSSSAETRLPGDVGAVRHAASMGPRIFIRGNMVRMSDSFVLPIASMGPRIFIRGNIRKSGNLRLGAGLQWGRGSSSAETRSAAGRQDRAA